MLMMFLPCVETAHVPAMPTAEMVKRVATVGVMSYRFPVPRPFLSGLFAAAWHDRGSRMACSERSYHRARRMAVSLSSNVVLAFVGVWMWQLDSLSLVGHDQVCPALAVPLKMEQCQLEQVLAAVMAVTHGTNFEL